VIEEIDTVVVGGGQAGLAMSYHLKGLGREHVVLERGRVAQSWRSERWDSLMFQFPNWSIQLPGYNYETDNPDSYVPKNEIVRFIETYAALIDAPLRCGLRVVALRQNSASSRLLVETEEGSSFEAVNVVVATGPFHLPQIPAFAASMPVELFQVHSRDYRNPSQLAAGAVLVVGSGASGSQIAEELHQAGRKVYLSTGRFHKTPRRYRGRDIYWWFEALGIWHRPLELQPEVRNLRFVVTGAGGGHDIDLRRFAVDGMTLLGRLRGFADGKLQFRLTALHAGEAFGRVILQDIVRGIQEAKVVIAEITPKNRNVYYEVGYAHALNLPTILLVAKDTELPFDIKGYRCIFYENTIAGRRIAPPP